MTMKVVLIIPPFDLSAAWGSTRHMKEGILPPMGVGYLAAALEDRGHTVELLDAPSQGWGMEQTVGHVAESGAAIAGISCLTVRSGAAYNLARAVKARYPEMIVAMGGPHVTAYHEHILDECPEVDVLLPGEAEISFAAFVDAVAAGHPWDSLLGVIYRTGDGSVHHAEPQPLVRDLDTLTPPARHLYPKNLYRPLPSQGRRLPSTIMLTSRGCPWSKCRFCYQGARYGHPYRRRSPENCIEEIRHLVRGLGYREIMFWDDNFCVNEQWVSRFCDLLDQEGLNITWTAEGHVRTVTRSMLRRMAASGCYNVFFGIESGTQEMLDLTEKGFTLDDARAAVGWAKRAGMEVRASFLLGFPTETPEMADRTIRFACEINPDFANFVPFHVWPGTPMEEYALQHGRSVPWNDNFVSPSYVPESFGSFEALNLKIKEAYRRFYFRPRYIAATLWRLRKPRFARRVLRGSRYWISLIQSAPANDENLSG
jgi:radical SAM superfamily enzyme YgiQ (UPF0313 family)